MSTDGPRHSLTTREGWNAFVSRPTLPEPPRLLAAADLERLDPDERDLYNYARMDYHSELNLVATPDIRKITTTGEKLIIGNRGKQLGRRGLIVSGPSGTGKSTSITWLGKIHQVGTERRAPRGTGRIPVVYIIVPPAATPKMLAIEIAAFLGLPFSSHEPQHFITQSVAGVLRKVGCSLILVDEVHRLDLRTRPGAAASDQLKYFFDSVSATFVYAGLDLAENGMFAGMRGRQIAGRFISLATSAFGYATEAEKEDWHNLVAPIEAARCPPCAGSCTPASRCRQTGRPSASTGCIPGQPAASASWPRQARPGRPSCSCPAGLRWPAGVTGAGSASRSRPASMTCPQPGTSSPPTVSSPGSWPAAATAPGPTANSLLPGTWPRTGPGASPGACPSSASDGASGLPHSASPRPGSSRPGS